MRQAIIWQVEDLPLFSGTPVTVPASEFVSDEVAKQPRQMGLRPDPWEEAE